MKISTLLLFFLLAQIVLPAQHANVLISTANSPNEPTIFINSLYPDTILAASNIRNYYISYDAGYTWTEHVLSSSYGVWGDPVIINDTLGDFYFFHLSNPPSGNWIDRIVCQKSSNGGQSWTNGTYMGLNGTKAQDKQWAVVDKQTNTIYVTWTEFDNYGSTSSSCYSRILFSKSTDGGATWSAAIKINETDGDCIDEDETVEGAVPAVGPNGEIYVAWAGPDGLVFDRSTDGGASWLSQDIFVDGMPFGWDFSIPGISRANGLPITKCDLSGGPNHGTIYINWCDQSNGADNTDVWLAKSIDGGFTWSSPERVNQDNSQKHQFFTWMDIDQSTGCLYFVYYDRRAYSDNQTDVYLAYSVDGGAHFKEEKISDSPFVPNPGVFFGDYNNIAVHQGIIRPIWTRLNGGSLSIYTAIIDTSLLDYSIPLQQTDTLIISDTIIVNDTLYITDTIFINGDTVIVYDTVYTHLNNNPVFEVDAVAFPNPSSSLIYFSFKLHQKASVSLAVFNIQGQAITKILDEKSLNFGKHIFSIDSKESGLSAGTYFYTLSIDGYILKKKPLIIY